MNTPQPTARRHSPRAGRALVLLALALGLALLGAGYWLGRMKEAAPSETALAGPSRALAPSVSAPAVPDPEPGARVTVPPRATPPASAPTQQAGSAAATREGTGAERAPENRERLELAQDRQERAQRLRRGEDPEERLALAREILAEEPNSSLMLYALQTLAELDPTSAADEVRKRLENEDDPRGKAMMATVISMVGSNESALSASDLAGFYDVGDKDVQLAAARALASRGDTSLTVRFREERTSELSAEDPAVRAEAVRQLSSTRQPDTLSLITPLLADPDPLVRTQALRSVCQSGSDEQTLEAIRPLLNDESEQVRRTAERQVQSIERRMELRRR